MTLDSWIQIQAVQKIKGVESLIIESSWVEPLNPVGSFILDSQAINLQGLSFFKKRYQSFWVSLFKPLKIILFKPYSSGSIFPSFLEYIHFPEGWAGMKF